LVRELYDPENKMILLMKGDIERVGGGARAYPEGVRESGQYTHGVGWVIKALFELGEGDLATQMLTEMLPNVHAEDPRYQAEPFSLAADILAGEHLGEAGWTWYSGSAGWIVRIMLEDLLGMKVSGGDRLALDPCLPKDWPELSYVHRHGSASYEVRIENPDRVNRGVVKVLVDGEELARPAEGLRLKDDGGRHEVRVILGRTGQAQELRLADIAPDLAERFPELR
jgi:cyclic beta-1,2-glucan synthetase